jgi:outer membrane protein OmpA-like peptidoglycan-associated protein
MLGIPRNRRFAMVLACAALCHPGMALADPTADDIINSLKPNTALKGPTRGIRALPSSTPARAPAQARAGGDDRPSLDLSVQFQSGSANLTPAAIHTLDRLGKALASPQLADDRFRIEGHTDTVGTRETNKPLSQHRAEAVAAYLESTFGIAASRLEAVGVGEDDLLISTPDQTPEPRNRRVHIVNLSG